MILCQLRACGSQLNGSVAEPFPLAGETEVEARVVLV